MKKSLANQIAKLWNENFAGSTAATRTVAESDGENVWIKPTGENDGTCFYHNEEFADVMRCFKVSGIVCIRENQVLARLF